MWTFALAGFAAIVAFASQSKKQSAGVKTYEQGLKDGADSLKKQQEDEKKEQLKIEKIVQKRMGHRTSERTRRTSRLENENPNEE